MNDSLDYYQLLQVDRRADPKVIERVYKTLMLELRVHPDLGGDQERASLVNVAYQTLRDPERRRAYDEELARKETALRSLAQERALASLAQERALESLALLPVDRGPAPLVRVEAAEIEIEPPGPSYRTTCPRCRAQHEVPHEVEFDARLQCPKCHWFFRDPHRELAALRARILRLRPSGRPLAARLYATVAREQQAAEQAAAEGNEAAARDALRRKRRTLSMLADEVRWVRF